MDSTPLKPVLNRIEVIDAFRGFALAGIVIVHFAEQFVGGPTPEGAMDAVTLGPLDQGVNVIVNLFLRGKFFALFSLLFGLSFFIQMDRAAQRGTDFRLRFAWRLLLLFIIGYLHHLFYRGDILTIYAVLGFLLIFFYNVSNKWLALISILIFIGLPRYLIYGLHGTENMIGEAGFMPGSPELDAYFTLLRSGTIWSIFQSNASEGMIMKTNFQIGIISRGYLTFAFFLAGLMLGRMRFFEHTSDYIPKLKKAIKWSLGLIIIIIAAAATLFLTQNPSETEGLDSWFVMIGMTLYDLLNLSLTVIIFSLFIILYQKASVARFLDLFAPYGRTALSNYFFQSVIGTIIFYGWGLGLLGEIRLIYCFIFALIVMSLQMYLSYLWLRFFRYGPLEWLWRICTYTRFFPIRKERTS